MPCVETHPASTSVNHTHCAKQAILKECDMNAAWNEMWCIYQDCIHLSLRTLAWFSPETTYFSQTSSENLPKVPVFLMYPSAHFWYYSPYILDACGSTDWVTFVYTHKQICWVWLHKQNLPISLLKCCPSHPSTPIERSHLDETTIFTYVCNIYVLHGQPTLT